MEFTNLVSQRLRHQERAQVFVTNHDSTIRRSLLTPEAPDHPAVHLLQADYRKHPRRRQDRPILTGLVSVGHRARRRRLALRRTNALLGHVGTWAKL